MNNRHMSLRLLIVACLVHMSVSSAITFIPRSQSVNTALELSGWTHEVNQANKGDWYGTGALTLEGGKSFRNKNIARSFFGDDLGCGDCGSISISGSRVENRGENDWLADYFGLPTDYRSRVSINPSIAQFMADFDFYFGWNKWINGLYARINAPVVWNRWDLNLCESYLGTSTASYIPGYFNNTGVAHSDLACSFLQFASGNYALEKAGDITINPLRCARLPLCSDSIWKLADLRMILGWNFLLKEAYHLGIGAIVAAPTGNKPTNSYIFQPVIGNGHHWELGAQITTHYTFWKDEIKNRSFGFYLDANITHLFKNDQIRCFDLCGKPNSQYMLAQKITSTTALDSSVNTGVGFSREFTSVANLTARNVDVSIAVQGDVSILFNYTCKNFGWDVGYNFWGLSCEKISLDCNACDDECDPCNKVNTTPLDGKTWALKGDAAVFGFESSAPQAVNLAATESKADIHGGTNKFTGPSNTQGGINGIPPIANPGVDNPVAARTTGTVFADVALTTTTHTSNPPVFLSESDIDFGSNRSKGLSNSFFTHISYTWHDRESYVPYLGAGVKVEVGGNLDCMTTCVVATTTCTPSCSTSCEPVCETPACTSCSSCKNIALSSWQAWIKGGVSFN